METTLATWQECRAPSNVVSKRSNRGLNLLLLDVAATRHNLSSRWWATFQQWKTLGGKVMRRPADVPEGKWGTQIIFWAPIVKTIENENGEEKEDRFFFMRTYTVFNVDQVEGLDHLRAGQPEPGESLVIDYQPAEAAVEASLSGMQLSLRFGGARRFTAHLRTMCKYPRRRRSSPCESTTAPSFTNLFMRRNTNLD